MKVKRKWVVRIVNWLAGFCSRVPIRQKYFEEFTTGRQDGLEDNPHG